MKKKYILVLILSMTLVLLNTSFVRADDDDDDDEEDERSQTTSSASTNSTSTVIRMVTQTIVLQPAKTVTSEIMQNVELVDSDRDGVPDEQDLYPKIPQQLIVEDINLDGIDDMFELES